VAGRVSVSQKYEARADFASRPRENLIRRYGELLSGKPDK